MNAKLNKIVKAVEVNANKAVVKLKKRSPELCLAFGVVGFVATVVVACKATTKVGDVLEETQKTVETIHKCEENEDLKKTGEYTEKDSTKDLIIVYTKTGVKLLKLYAPSLIIGTFSISCMLGSHYLLHKRNVALAAAYTAVDKSFKEYRQRVVERYGADVDKELRFNVKAKTFEETVVNEKGKEKTVEKEVNIINGQEYSDYARIFDERNYNFEKDSQYNLMFIRSQERLANDKLIANGYLFLNEVYDMLGFQKTKAGQIIGWVYKPDNPVGDNYVDFGLSEFNRESVRDFINGYERCIVLDFNVDGYILDNL